MTTHVPSSRGRLGRSRRAGVATVLPAPATVADRQLSLPIEPSAPPGADGTRHRRRVLPGVVHIRGWLAEPVQRALVSEFRRWAVPPAGLRHPRVPRGHLMSVQSVCLGWHWQPYAYSRTADDTDGAPVKPLPASIVDLARSAIADASGSDHPDAAGYAPDAAIVNLDAPGAHLGLHQDGEEPSAAPVVTISLGDACVFRLAGVDRRTGPFTDVELRSGDLLVFGGPNRAGDRAVGLVPRLRTNVDTDEASLQHAVHWATRPGASRSWRGRCWGPGGLVGIA
ncbi:MAG: alpha-ketoglutarate-dependent dioxygenase AlkB, partial [Acidimicrobiales bacterium]